MFYGKVFNVRTDVLADTGWGPSSINDVTRVEWIFVFASDPVN
jgi:hypothetical protein